MLQQNSLERAVFENQLDFKTLENILDTLDHVTAEKVSRADFNKLQGNFLQENGEDKFGKKYILYLPEDLVYGEVLQIIDYLSQKFGLENYTRYGRLITQTKVMIGVILRGMGKDDGEIYLNELALKYSLSHEFIERLKSKKEGGDKISISEAKEVITSIKSKRKEKSNKKIGTVKDDIDLGTEELKNSYHEELQLTFIRKGVNLLREGMRTITQAEQKYLRQNQKDGDKVFFHISDEELDEKERLLRDKIGIDKLKQELQEARVSGNQEKIQEIELKATNSIFKAIYEYPYQITSNNFGFQPNKIAEFKEIYCVGFSLLGHAFLSELGIKHNGLDIPEHTALEVIIGGKRYYFDATSNGQIFEFNYGKENGAYREINLVGGYFSRKIYAYSGNPEKILLSHIYNNKGTYLYELGKYDEAIKMYNESIKLNPNYSAVHNNKGNALYELGKYDEAIKMYNESIKLNPNYLIAHNNKGNALYELGKYDEAIKMYNEALRLNPGNLVIYNNKGNVLAGIGKIVTSELYAFTYKLLNNSLTFNDDLIFKSEKSKIRDFIKKGDFNGLREYLLEIEEKEK